MGFFPDVNAGDQFVPNARLSNEVRHIVNRMNGFLSGTITAGKTTGSLCIKGYNPTSDETIAAGNVVIIPEGPIVEDAFPVATMIDGEYHMLVDSWGIAQEEIGPKQVGSVLVMGAAIVPIISETGTDTFEYVKPVAGGGSFKKAKRGIAKYIRPIGTTHALIFVGISSGLVYEQGKGVKITGGAYGISPTISSEIEGGTDIGVSGGTDGQPYVISYTGSGGGGGDGIGFPDYLALNKLPSGGSMPTGEGIGTTYLLPVPAGKSIKYYSPIQYCVALFAVADEWDGTPQVLTNDTAYTTPAAGWVRISILDDGQHQNGCLRFYVGTDDWSKALPLYRCGTFRVGATGISSTISGSTAAEISLTGGTGSVIIKPGNNNVSIDGSTAGVIKISATGGGGGGSGLCFPDYAALTTSSSSGTVLVNGTDFVATSDGWLRVSIRNDSGLSDGCFRLTINGADIGFYQYRTGSPGVTKFVYIPNGSTVSYSTSSNSSFVKFAPGIGGSGMPAPIYSAMAGTGGTALTKGTTYSIPENGWIRISIRNDDNLSDGCFRLYFDSAEIGFYQYRTGSCGITDFIPIQAGTEFRFETTSTSYYVKYDH